MNQSQLYNVGNWQLMFPERKWKWLFALLVSEVTGQRQTRMFWKRGKKKIVMDVCLMPEPESLKSLRSGRNIQFNGIAEAHLLTWLDGCQDHKWKNCSLNLSNITQTNKLWSREQGQSCCFDQALRQTGFPLRTGSSFNLTVWKKVFTLFQRS